MSLYTKARKHIDMNRVKELREEAVKEQKIAEVKKQQEEILAELKRIEIKENPKYSNWKRDLENLNETMTTAGLGMVNYPPEGNVNLGAAMSNISLSGDGGEHGFNAITRSSTSSYKQFDTMVVTISTSSSDWVIEPGHVIIGLASGGSGSHTVVIPRTYSSLYFSAKDDGTFSASVQYQRRAPVNVFVSLDDPDASAFIRDGDFDRLSNEQKKKKLEEQLRSSDEYLNKMFGEGMPKGATEIADYEPQQSFMDIQVGDQRITKQDGRTITDTTRGIESQPTPQPTPTPTPTPTPQPTPTKSAVPRLYQNKSASWMAGAVGSSSVSELTDTFRGTTVDVSKVKGLSDKANNYQKQIAAIGAGAPTFANEAKIKELQGKLNNTREQIKSEIEGGKPDLKPVTQAPKSSDNQAELEKNIEASLKQLDIDNKQLKGDALKRNLSFAADLGLGILTVITLLSPIPGDEAAVISAQAAKQGIKTASKQTASAAVKKALTDPNKAKKIQQAVDDGYMTLDDFINLPIDPKGKFPHSVPKNIKNNLRMDVQSYQPQGKVIKEKKSFKDLTKKIPGYYDGKPSPLGFPVEEPPKMVNGYHPDLVDGKKVANRFNRLDLISARAMPKTGNPHIDKKVRAAAKKPK